VNEKLSLLAFLNVGRTEVCLRHSSPIDFVKLIEIITDLNIIGPGV